MKKLISTIVMFGMLAMSSVTWAVPIYGDEDLLKGSAVLANSNSSTEASFVNGILGTSFTATDLEQLSNSWTLVDQSHGAFALVGDPLWFLVKAGNTHYLYENKAEFGWAYVDYADAGMPSNNNGVYTGIGISHYSELGSTPVPEPGTMMLLGLGMLGMAIYGKRRMNREA